jgi:hypothetical protein
MEWTKKVNAAGDEVYDWCKSSSDWMTVFNWVSIDEKVEWMIPGGKGGPAESVEEAKKMAEEARKNADS